MRLFIYNKPLGEEVEEKVYTPKDVAEDGTVTLHEDESVKIYPVSDLGKDTARGLVIYTDDASQVEMLKKKVSKAQMEYHVDTEVDINKKLNVPVIQQIRAGVVTPDGRSSAGCKISWTEQFGFVIQIAPCSDKYLSDLCEAVGYKCVRLRRFRIGNLKVKKVALCEFGEYSAEEVEAFLAL